MLFEYILIIMDLNIQIDEGVRMMKEEKPGPKQEEKNAQENQLLEKNKKALFGLFSAKEKKLDANEKLIQETVKERKRFEKNNVFQYFWKNLKTGEYSGKQINEIIGDLRQFRAQKESTLEKYKAYETVISASTDSAEYYILLIFSCIIASLGLIQNSAAVIIGAMVVAPLMPPVLGFSAGVLWGSFKAIREGFTTLLKGAVLTVAIAALLGFIIPGIILTPEIQVRTAPSFFDIIIALCCGFIGAYAYINKKIANVIPGIAISVALMPPLCSIGLCLGLQNWQEAKGAGLLLLINLLGISLAAVIVFAIIRLHPQAEGGRESGRALRRAAGQIVLTIVLLSVLAVPLALFTASELEGNIIKDEIQKIVEESWPEADIETLKIKDKNGQLIIECLLLFPEEKLEQDLDAEAIEKEITKKTGKKSRLLLYTLYPQSVGKSK